jgi:hypothetical protein
MNNFKNNFIFLKNDLKKEISNIFKFTKKSDLANFKEINRKEVLFLYRHLLKTVPKMQNSYFEEKYTYEVSLDF